MTRLAAIHREIAAIEKEIRSRTEGGINGRPGDLPLASQQWLAIAVIGPSVASVTLVFVSR